jgi:hypothetical protein
MRLAELGSVISRALYTKRFSESALQFMRKNSNKRGENRLEEMTQTSEAPFLRDSKPAEVASLR